MKKKWIKFIFITLLIIWGFDFGNTVIAAQQSKQRIFVGVDKCKICHKKQKKGDQYRIWKESLHSKAFDTLGNEKAKEYAKERGIDNPQTAEECLKCHVTAYGIDKQYLGKKYKMTDGVGCESCHGAGGDYYKLKTMKAITTGKQKAASVGLIIPNEKVCIKCHNDESPAYKEFKFEEFVKKIVHTIPVEVKEKLKNELK